MFYYLNNFFFFSIFGYFFESIMFLLLSMHNQSGFLHLFWTPFYGTGVIITILLDKLVKKFKLKEFQYVVVLSVLLFLTLTILEYIGGIALEYLFGYSLWTYEHIPLHIGKYISIPTSIGWVCFSFFYLLIKKYTDKLILKIPKFISISFLIIFVIDNIITIYQVLHFRDFF